MLADRSTSLLELNHSIDSPAIDNIESDDVLEWKARSAVCSPRVLKDQNMGRSLASLNIEHMRLIKAVENRLDPEQVGEKVTILFHLKRFNLFL